METIGLVRVLAGRDPLTANHRGESGAKWTPQAERPAVADTVWRVWPLNPNQQGAGAPRRRPGTEVATYQPYWALRAHLLARAGRLGEARACYGRAMGLSEDPAVRTFLAQRGPAGE